MEGEPLSTIILYNWDVRDRRRQFLLSSLAISLTERVLKITPENVISAVTSGGREGQEHAQ
jgi:hypothetical protein